MVGEEKRKRRTKMDDNLTKEQLNQILSEIKKNTTQTAFRLKLDKNCKPAWTDSKFGGVPYWDTRMEYPVSSEGGKMYLLAQINFSELPENDIFPKSGILQFFIAGDDIYGIDFDEPDSQKGFRVVFHKEIRQDITEADVMELDIPTTTKRREDDSLPLETEYAVSIEKAEVSMGIFDYRYEEMFKESAKALGIAVSNEDRIYDLLDEEEYSKQCEQSCNTGHWLLGYPYFTQEDPRTYKEELRTYDTMLFQMDSEGAGRYEIIWGDSGVANFYITKEALEKGDFSEVMYNWDCF